MARRTSVSRSIPAIGRLSGRATPFAGVIRDVGAGIGVTLQAEGRMLRGVEVLGDPTRGVLAGAGIERGGDAGPGLVLRPGSLDVGLSGSILVVGSRIEAETLT